MGRDDSSVGTGVIWKRFVLTCAHNLVDDGLTEVWARTPKGRLLAKKHKVPDEYTSSGNSPWDYAVLKLDAPYSNQVPVRLEINANRLGSRLQLAGFGDTHFFDDNPYQPLFPVVSDVMETV